MKIRIIAIIVLVLAITVAGIYYYSKSNTEGSDATENSDTSVKGYTIEGYVREVDLDNRSIFITLDFENVTIKEYLADCVLYIGPETAISDGRDLDSIVQGEHIVATYVGIGSVAETRPAQVHRIVLIQLD